ALPSHAVAPTRTPLRVGGRGGVGAGEQLAHLLVGGRSEVLVPQTDGVERLRCTGTNDVVGLGAQLGARFRRPDPHPHHPPPPPPPPAPRRAPGRRRAGRPAFPRPPGGALPPRSPPPRPRSPCSPRSVPASIVSAPTPTIRTTSSLRTRTPPEAIAPIASSSC